MESGIDAFNRIKETRNRFLAIQKLSKEIFEKTIIKINELKCYHEEITADKLLLEKKKSTLAMLEMSNLILDERIIILESILNDKKQSVENQEDLLKVDQQNILSARSSYCDRVYKYLNEYQPTRLPSTIDNNWSKELNDLNRQIQNFENELQTLNENILKKDLQKQHRVEENEEIKYQQLLEDRKETLKNLTQKVKHLKFNRRQNKINLTIENLYHRNNFTNIPVTENTSESEISNYFNNASPVDIVKQSETLNKIKNLRAAKVIEPNSKPSVPKINQSFVPNQDNFNRNAVKRCKIGKESISSTNGFASDKTSSSSDVSSGINEIRSIADNNRRKFVPKKPIFSSKLM